MPFAVTPRSPFTPALPPIPIKLSTKDEPIILARPFSITASAADVTKALPICSQDGLSAVAGSVAFVYKLLE